MCDNCGCDAIESQKRRRRDKTKKHDHHVHVHADGMVHSHEHDHEHGCVHPHSSGSTVGGRRNGSAPTDKSDKRQ